MDSDWLDAGAERVAYYSQLPPGKYDFRVMVGSSLAGWQESASTYSLEVIPLWWQTAWFRVGAGICAAAAVAGIIVLNERRKLRRRLERLEMQHALENERRRIARDLHDDLGAQLTEIFLTGEMAKRGARTLPELQHQLGGMTQKVRSVVTAMEEVVWTVNPRNDTLPNLAAYLCDFLERFLSATSIRLRLDVADDLPDVSLAAQTRHNVLLAVKEAANNTLKHSHATEITLEIHARNGCLAIALRDNGVGFDVANPPESTSGNGLLNLRCRLEDLGGQTQITSQPGSGTMVKLLLPLSGRRSKNGKPEAGTARSI
jgi:signal transduction histidine kinase